MGFNKISRARNLLNEARKTIGEIRVDPEVHGPVLILLMGISDSLKKAVAILEPPPPEQLPGRPVLVYSRKGPLEPAG